MSRAFRNASPRGGHRDSKEIVGGLSCADYRRKLREALGAGVEALMDLETQERVEDYFRENPRLSRDSIHVATVACRFKKEQVAARQFKGMRVANGRGDESAVAIASISNESAP